MADTVQNGVSHLKGNKQVYTHPYNMVTLVMWVIALSSHAILIPLFVREVLLHSKGRSTKLFG